MVKLNTGLKLFALFQFAQTETARMRTNRKNISNDSDYFCSFRSIGVLGRPSFSRVREMSLAMFSGVESYPASAISDRVLITAMNTAANFVSLGSFRISLILGLALLVRPPCAPAVGMVPCALLTTGGL